MAFLVKMATFVKERVSALRPSGKSMADKYVEILDQTIAKFRANPDDLKQSLETFITAGKKFTIEEN